MRKFIIRLFTYIIKTLTHILNRMLAKGSDRIINAQSMYTALHMATLQFMNYGGTGNFIDSGEKHALDVVSRLMNKIYKDVKLVLFDVGANIGDYSIEMVKAMGDKAHIFSFEPIDSTYNELVMHTQCYKNISPHNIGLSDAPGIIPVYTTNEECSVLSSIYKHNKDFFHYDLPVTKDCRFDTVDSFCKDNQIDHVHFLKMDVEGHEMAVLKGAINMLGGGKIDLIQFEFGGCNIASRTYFQDFWYFLNEKYYLYRIVSEGLIPIKKYNVQMEIFMYSNFLAVRKELA